MFTLVIIVVFFFLIIWLINLRLQAGKRFINKVEPCLRQIEINPDYPEAYDRLLAIFRSLDWEFQKFSLIKYGFHRRILSILDCNRFNLKAWELLTEVIMVMGEISGWDNTLSDRDKELYEIAKQEILTTIVDILFQEFNNLLIKEEVFLSCF